MLIPYYDDEFHSDFVFFLYSFQPDKIGLGGTAKIRKSSALPRPHSESDFTEIDEMQAKEPPLTDRQVEEQFQQMLDDMNLSEEKRQPLLEQSIDKKRQLLSMREKGYSTVIITENMFKWLKVKLD